MNKFIFVVIFIVTFFSGCSNKITDSNYTDQINSEAEVTVLQIAEAEQLENTDENYQLNNILFPNGKDEITEYNKEILAIDPFTISFVLPCGWNIESEKPNANSYIYNATVFSTQYIYNENNICVGAVGYNVIPDLSEDELIPAAIYGQIAIGNGYRFDIREKYDIIKSSDTYESALTDVYYSNVFNNDNGEKLNKGIVMYDTTIGVYIAFEFDSNTLIEKDYNKIAESLEIT